MLKSFLLVLGLACSAFGQDAYVQAPGSYVDESATTLNRRVLHAPVRQSVLASHVDASGLKDFITYDSNSITISASTTPLIITVADGFNQYGPVDYVFQIKNNTNVTRIVGSNNYIFATYNPNTGATGIAATAIAPVVGKVLPNSASNGQFAYSTVLQKMFRYTDSTWNDTPAIFFAVLYSTGSLTWLDGSGSSSGGGGGLPDNVAYIDATQTFSGINTFSQTISGNISGTAAGNALVTRNINTTSPLSGGGDLSADRTLAISQASSGSNGYLSSTDWNTFNNKQPAGNYGVLEATQTWTGTNTYSDLLKISSGIVTSFGNNRGLGAIDLQVSKVDPGAVASGDYSALGGGYGNRATALASVVPGGYLNTIGTSASYSAIAGGYNNSVTLDHSFVGGGDNNTVGGGHAIISGGYYNLANGDRSVISGGQYNATGGQNAAILGGSTNTASAYMTTIAGGLGNTASTQYAAVLGGHSNTASGDSSVVSGGNGNTSSNLNTTVGGGYNNSASNQYDTVAGGENNAASGNNSFVGGGNSNAASASASTIAGGYSNKASGAGSIVAGGSCNTASGGSSFIGSGWCNNYQKGNVASGDYSTIGGGGPLNSYWFPHLAAGRGSTISGGGSNQALGMYSTVPGGTYNTAQGNFSYAAGMASSSTATGAFTWNDATSQTTPLINSTANSVLFRNSGGFATIITTNPADGGLFMSSAANVGIGTSAPAYKLQVQGTGYFASTMSAPSICISGDCRSVWPSTPGGDAILSATQTFSGTDTFTQPIVGSVTGNAGTVTNGVYTSGSYANPSWITSLDTSKVDLSTVTTALNNVANATTTLHSEQVSVARIDLSTVTTAINARGDAFLAATQTWSGENTYTATSYVLNTPDPGMRIGIATDTMHNGIIILSTMGYTYSAPSIYRGLAVRMGVPHAALAPRGYGLDTQANTYVSNGKGYGVYSKAFGIGSANVGIYGYANNAETGGETTPSGNWAGYFDGNVYSSGTIMTNRLTTASTMTVQGNAFSVGGSTFAISAGTVAIGGLLRYTGATPSSGALLVSDGSGNLSYYVHASSIVYISGYYTVGTTYAAVTGSTATITTSQTSDITVTFSGSLNAGQTGNTANCRIIENGVALSPLIQWSGPGSTFNAPIAISVLRKSLAAGTWAYALQCSRDGGTFTVASGATSVSTTP